MDEPQHQETTSSDVIDVKQGQQQHKKICKVQACGRGTLVRRQLRQLRHKYEVLVQELGDPAFPVHITWTSTLPCVSTVQPKSKSRIQVKQTADKHVTKTSDQDNAWPSKKDASTETVFPRDIGEDCIRSGRTQTENTEHLHSKCQAGEIVNVKRTSTKIDGGTLDQLGHESRINNQDQSQIGTPELEGSKQLLPPLSENQENQIRTNCSETDTVTDARRESPSPRPESMEEVPDKGNLGEHLGSEGRYKWTSELYTPSQRTHDDIIQDGLSLSKKAAHCDSVDHVHSTDNHSEVGPEEPHVGQASLAEETSVWELEDSFAGVPGIPGYPTDPIELRKMRSHISMELLWVQQAITSRKNYLRMKHKLEQ
ncbi:Hypp4521 [Branchiostoma lanceolatum]|uniref:Hypp4521 protein n=1 Tax=Branchiostoma lanceolatum TaxID=7740 RepID=A0A8K0A7W1_BRALA|nr:Hypp4521 [Branchiostoma lanceolatum]